MRTIAWLAVFVAGRLHPPTPPVSPRQALLSTAPSVEYRASAAEVALDENGLQEHSGTKPIDIKVSVTVTQNDAGAQTASLVRNHNAAKNYEPQPSQLSAVPEDAMAPEPSETISEPETSGTISEPEPGPSQSSAIPRTGASGPPPSGGEPSTHLPVLNKATGTVDQIHEAPHPDDQVSRLMHAKEAVIAPYTECEQEVQTVENDARKYKCVKLHTGLTVIVIQDEEADKAAFSMAVNVGSWFDPPQYPGLAHFLEHMLFLGTETYTGDDDYFQYLEQNGGDSNAYTSSTLTNFYGNVAKEKFEGKGAALDRFSKFFTESLMNTKKTDVELDGLPLTEVAEKRRKHEKTIVDGEWKKNKDVPGYQMELVLQTLAADNSVESKFNIGSTESLEDATVAGALKPFFETYYCPKEMSLVISSPHMSTEEMANLAADLFKGFDRECSEPTEVFKKKEDILANAAEAFPPDSVGKAYLVDTSGSDQLTIVWSLDASIGAEMRRKYSSGISDIMSYVFGTETKGGVQHDLLLQGLVTGVSAGFSGMNIKGTDMWDEKCKVKSQFQIEVGLTAQGAKNVPVVLKAIGQFLEFVKTSNVPYEQLYDAFQVKSELALRYRESKGYVSPTDLVQNLAAAMSFIPIKDLRHDCCWIKNKEHDLLKKLLESIPLSKAIALVQLTDANLQEINTVRADGEKLATGKTVRLQDAYPEPIGTDAPGSETDKPQNMKEKRTNEQVNAVQPGKVDKKLPHIIGDKPQAGSGRILPTTKQSASNIHTSFSEPGDEGGQSAPVVTAGDGGHAAPPEIRQLVKWSGPIPDWTAVMVETPGSDLPSWVIPELTLIPKRKGEPTGGDDGPHKDFILPEVNSEWAAKFPEQVEEDTGVWWMGHFSNPKGEGAWKPYPNGHVSLRITPNDHAEEPMLLLKTESKPNGFMFIASSVLVAMISKVLRVTLEQFEMADMKWAIGYDGGYFVEVAGYQSGNNLQLLSQYLLGSLAHKDAFSAYAEANTEKDLESWFTTTRHELLQKMENHGPQEQSAISSSAFKVEIGMTRDERKIALEQLEFADMDAVYEVIRKGVQYRGMVSGNYPKGEAAGVVQDLLKKSFDGTIPDVFTNKEQAETADPVPYKAGTGLNPRYRSFDPAVPEVDIAVKNPRSDADPNSYVVFSQQLPELPTYAERAQLHIIGMWVGYKAFNFLRTERMLGYVAGGSIYGNAASAQGLVLFLLGQSDPKILQSTVMEMHAKIHGKWEQEDFDKWKLGALKALEMTDHTTGQRHSRMWQYMNLNYFCFDNRERLRAAVEEVTKKDVEALSERLLKQPLVKLTVYAGQYWSDVPEDQYLSSYVEKRRTIEKEGTPEDKAKCFVPEAAEDDICHERGGSGTAGFLTNLA